MRCKYCRREIADGDNFCNYCSRKVREVCSCWVLKKPHNCGLEKCPGYGLFLTESYIKKMSEKSASEVSGEA